MKHLFIINPAAGKADSTNAVSARIRAVCQSRGLDYEIHTTDHPRHATQLVREKAAEYFSINVPISLIYGNGFAVCPSRYMLISSTANGTT